MRLSTSAALTATGSYHPVKKFRCIEGGLGVCYWSIEKSKWELRLILHSYWILMLRVILRSRRATRNLGRGTAHGR